MTRKQKNNMGLKITSTILISSVVAFLLMLYFWWYKPHVDFQNVFANFRLLVFGELFGVIDFPFAGNQQFLYFMIVCCTYYMAPFTSVSILGIFSIDILVILLGLCFLLALAALFALFS